MYLLSWDSLQLKPHQTQEYLGNDCSSTLVDMWLLGVRFFVRLQIPS